MTKIVGKYLIIFSVLILCVIWMLDRYTFGYSKSSGFYESPFEVRIGKPIGTRVYYTLDGTTPTVDSAEYVSPILIGDASDNPNCYSVIEDIVPEYGKKVEGIPLYVVPKDNIDKCNVIRAICVNKNGEIIEEKQASYFVGFDEKCGYDGMWICSVITDPDNLFDSKTGIMVCGDSISKNAKGHYENANYDGRGLEWEREAFVQFYNPNRQNVLSQKCGIRIHGKGSRRFASKSFSLYSREEYDGNDKFRYDFWGDGYLPDKMMLFSAGEDIETLVRNKLVSDLTRDSSYSSYHYVPCVLFIDGEYWGIQFISEKFDKEYFNHYYDTDKEDLLVIKELIGSPEYSLVEGLFDLETDSDKWNNFAIVNSGREEMGINQELIEKTFDYGSFLDYFATEIYIARCSDWPKRNMAYWSTRTNGTGQNDGKWRYLLYDVYRESMSDSRHDTIGEAREKYPLLDYELNNEKFRNDLRARLVELSENEFSDESIGNYLDEYSELIREPIIKHYQRFYGNQYDGERFDEAIEGLKEFFKARKDFIREYEF